MWVAVVGFIKLKGEYMLVLGDTKHGWLLEDSLSMMGLTLWKLLVL